MPNFMRNLLSLFFSCVLLCTISAQDNYHNELINQLADEYEIENPSFVLQNNEEQNSNDFYIYGGSTLVNEDVSNFTFTKKSVITVNSVGTNPWDSGCGNGNKSTIQQDDIVLFAFWARSTSDESSLNVFAEDNTTYEKEIYSEISFTQDWTQYFIAFRASKTYTINKINFGFHLANAIQSLEIAGFTALNYGDTYSLSDVPSLFNPANYGGYELDAPWRAEAATRIDEIRKSNLTVKVVDLSGNPVEGASVQVDMTKHDFGFGTAVVSCRFEGNDCPNPTYVDKITNLDGNGHGFNLAVTENSLKWDAWEEEWISSPVETKAAITKLDEMGLEVRGHVLVWPGWSNLPNDMQQNSSNLDYLKTRIDQRLVEMLEDEVLGEIIEDWDVINEIMTNRDLENAFMGSAGYDTGRELYIEIFNRVAELKPENKNYLNDYVTLSNGGFGQATTDTYKSFVQEIKDGGGKLDGIGFQAHIGPFPTSILKVKETLDDFDALFDVEMKITEYDIDDKVEPDVQAAYLTDFLTMVFSHPKMEAFLMWGFWDGNHWKGNAPMFDMSWNLKPSGFAFNDLVFNQWWTNESGTSASNGEFVTAVFKGEHTITVNYNNQTFIVDRTIIDEETVEIMVDPTAIFNQKIGELKINPNPSKGNFRVSIDTDSISGQLVVMDIHGKVIQNSKMNDEEIMLDLLPGFYVVELTRNGRKYMSKLIIE